VDAHIDENTSNAPQMEEPANNDVVSNDEPQQNPIVENEQNNEFGIEIIWCICMKTLMILG
jgi:hypothetical protein